MSEAPREPCGWLLQSGMCLVSTWGASRPWLPVDIHLGSFMTILSPIPADQTLGAWGLGPGHGQKFPAAGGHGNAWVHLPIPSGECLLWPGRELFCVSGDPWRTRWASKWLDKAHGPKRWQAAFYSSHTFQSTLGLKQAAGSPQALPLLSRQPEVGVLPWGLEFGDGKHHRGLAANPGIPSGCSMRLASGGSSVTLEAAWRCQGRSPGPEVHAVSSFLGSREAWVGASSARPF